MDNDRNRGLYGKYLVKKIRKGDGGVCSGSPTGLHIPAPGLGHACSYCCGPRPDELIDPPGPVFVLSYTTDPHSAVALAAYADSCEADYPQLAADLREALRGQPECGCKSPGCQWCEIHGDTGNPMPDRDGHSAPEPTYNNECRRGDR